MMLLRLLYYLFLLTVPLGPFPVYIVGGLTFDNIITILLFGTLLLTRLSDHNGNVYNKKLLMALGAFFTVGLFSALVSNDIVFAFRQWIGYFLYGGIFLLSVFSVRPIMDNKQSFTRFSFDISFRDSVRFLYAVSVMVSLVIIFLYAYHTSPEITGSAALVGKRFYFGKILGPPFHNISPRVDPNITAVGLGIGMLLGFVNLSVDRPLKLKNLLYLMSFALPLIAIFLSASRTVTLSLVVCVVIMFLPKFLQGLLYPNRTILEKRYSKKTFFYAIPIFISIPFSLPVINRFIGIYTLNFSTPSDSGRLDLYRSAFIRISSSIKSFFIGNGFMTGNPHNEYLRHFDGSGIIGFVFFLYLLYVVHELAFSNVKLDRITIVRKLLFWFLLVALLFYPFTKLLWVTLLLVLLPVYEKPRELPTISRHKKTMSKLPL